MNKYAIILAAGKGTRMKSKLDDKSKVSYEIMGVSLVKYVLDSLFPLNLDKIVTIVGFGSKTSIEIVKDYSEIAHQYEQKGTGHAIMQVAPILEGKEGATIILCGDTPLLKSSTLQKLMDDHLANGNKLSALGAHVPNPFGYGRLILDENKNLLKIVEQKNANEEEQKIDIVNTGVYVFDNKLLFEYLKKLTPNPLTSEYYLTDLIEMFQRDGQKMSVTIIEGEEEMKGINDRKQLYEALKIKQREINEKHMLSGVTIEDSQNTYIGPYVEIGADTVIAPNTYIYGTTRIGEKNIIGPGTYINNATIGDDNIVEFSYIEESHIGDNNHIGPYSHIRFNSSIEENNRIGNFVEIKNGKIEKDNKIAHLSYIGDTSIKENVNVGGGTIVANYDGVNKHSTEIESDVFVGSNSTIIAPRKIGKGSIVAAGSTITEDVEEGDLAIARQRQVNKVKYAAKVHQNAKNKEK